MRKFKLFVDFEKEEAWLNRMAAQGHLVTRAGPLYAFAPVTPGTAVVRVDYRPSMSPVDAEDYRHLFEDAGWRHLDGSRSGGPQYFASFSADTDVEADIFSDAASRAQRYRRALAGRAAILPVLIVALVLWLRSIGGLGTFASPRDWYLTPGLWEMGGLEFVAAFAFETIFVLLRVGGPTLLLAAGVVLLVQMAHQSVLLRRRLAPATN